MAVTNSKGRAFLIYREDDTTADTYNLVGATTELSYTMNNDTVDITTKDDAGVRQLLEGLFNYAVTVNCSGVTNTADSALNNVLDTDMMGGTHQRFAITRPGATTEYLISKYQVTSFEESAPDADAVRYNFTLESAGGGANNNPFITTTLSIN